MKNSYHLPPGPQGLPIVGNALQLRNNPLTLFESLSRRYGNMVTLHLGKRPLFLFFHPDHVRYVLTENARIFHNREVTGGLRNILGDGLLTIDGDFHRQQRRLVQPAFHRQRVEAHATMMVQQTQRMLETWQPGTQRNLAREMQSLTLRIIAKVLFSLDLNQQSNTLSQAFTHIIERPTGLLAEASGLAEEFLGWQIDTPWSPYGQRTTAKQTLDTFIYQLITQRREQPHDGDDVLAMLLEAQDGDTTLTDRQIRDQLMTFFAAGHETTASALTWTFYLLARNPAVREKLQHELRDVLAGRSPTVSDLVNLPYLEQVLTESMRLYPPAWRQARWSTEDFELGGYSFPAGSIIMISQWVTHRDPALWDQPEVFRPERWANKANIVPWSYFPFGGGSRICIGMPFAQQEGRLLLATILQSYIPELLPSTNLTLYTGITLRPMHGLVMQVQPTAKIP